MLKCLRLRRAFFLLGFLNIAACLSADAAAAYTVKRGVAIPVEGLPLEGIIKSVSNNDTGDIIIGGNSIDVDSISPVAYKVVGNIATVVS
ncbi:MAG: hypothetical protein WCN87_00210, partial [Chlamydiota bacterium]